MNQNFKSFLLLLAVSLLVITCKQKAKEGECIHDPAFVYVKVFDNQNVQIDNAIINIFDSYEDFENAKNNKNNSTDTVASAISNAAAASLLEVDPYIEHWILVSKYDSVQLKYLSSELSISKIDKLQSCSDYHITVQLTTVGGTVAFWTPSSLNLNIKVKFNNILDSLTGVSSTAPTGVTSPGTPNQLNFPVEAGIYQYQATAAGNCSWQGEVEVKDGEFIPVQLEPCQRTVVAFYIDGTSGVSNTGPNNKFPINIFIDNATTPVGALTDLYSGPTVTTSCPGTPPSDRILYVYLEPGVAHSYKAVSAAGSTVSCIWTGTTGVLDPNCSLNLAIKLGSGCN
jgi:hypothetical protein